MGTYQAIGKVDMSDSEELAIADQAAVLGIAATTQWNEMAAIALGIADVAVETVPDADTFRKLAYGIVVSLAVQQLGGNVQGKDASGNAKAAETWAALAKDWDVDILGREAAKLPPAERQAMLAEFTEIARQRAADAK